ncbi:RNA polymerase sigma-70 factor [Maribellus sediminis]|uniref:RNA polymerase sigma-70 factor n=1 Tax=Maribellus sediminis TaxID=2696285 RepID=UPI00143067C0|nr:RNA polymerase sigma-70 factor [Maribellus sediminis]
MRQNLNERLIVVHLKNKNHEVFEMVFNKHYEALVKFACHYLIDLNAAKDATQAVFIYLWEHCDELNIKTSVRSYLYQAVKNQCLNQLRFFKIRDKHELLYLEAILESDDKEYLQENELLNSIKTAVSKLPEKMQMVFERKYYNQLSVKEIAHEMSLSINTVKVHLHKSRNVVRKSFECAT